MSLGYQVQSSQCCFVSMGLSRSCVRIHSPLQSHEDHSKEGQAPSDDSLSDQVASITSTNDMAACESAFGSPDTESELPICSLGGLVKRVTDDLKIEFITYLGVDLPEGAGGDTD